MAIFSNPTLHNSTRWKNMRVGLLGGSFNPPHEGHLHISKSVLKSLHLDAVWWLVTPQNPLKTSKDLLPIEERLDLSTQIIDHPKIIATTIEEQFQSRYSYQTVRALKKHYPHTQFAWITGMDNAHNFHLWNRWKDILQEICMIHITRHPPVKLIKSCPVRFLSRQKHITMDRGAAVPLDSHTTYWLLQKKMINISSTEIRKKNNGKTTK